MVFSKEHYNLGLSTSGEQMGKGHDGLRLPMSSGPQSTSWKRKVHQGQISSLGLPLWNTETVWKKMQPAPHGSMLRISRVWTKPLPISMVLGKQGDEDCRGLAAITACLGSSLSSTLKAPFIVDPFSGFYTSSYTAEVKCTFSDHMIAPPPSQEGNIYQLLRMGSEKNP